jgi:hypothetical protein
VYFTGPPSALAKGEAPLYIINGYHAPLSQADHQASVAAFMARHGLSDVASQDLLDLLHLQFNPFHGSIMGSIHIWGQWSSFNRTWFIGP